MTYIQRRIHQSLRCLVHIGLRVLIVKDKVVSKVNYQVSEGTCTAKLPPNLPWL